MNMQWELASCLDEGDRFLMRGVWVTYLGRGESVVDIFGRDEFRLWCRREDTGAEGWVQFGQSGKVEVDLDDDLSQTQSGRTP
jgi:hypothetical protein